MSEAVNLPLPQSPSLLSLNRDMRVGSNGGWFQAIHDQPAPPPFLILCHHQLSFCRRYGAANGRRILLGRLGTSPPSVLYLDESSDRAALPSLAYQFPGFARNLAVEIPIAHLYLKE